MRGRLRLVQGPREPTSPLPNPRLVSLWRSRDLVDGRSGNRRRRTWAAPAVSRRAHHRRGGEKATRSAAGTHPWLAMLQTPPTPRSFTADTLELASTPEHAAEQRLRRGGSGPRGNTADQETWVSASWPGSSHLTVA